MSWISFKPLITWMIALFHPFFISVIDIQHNNKEATLEISVRTFTDDLEKMINKEYHVQIDLNDPKQKTKAEADAEVEADDVSGRITLPVSAQRSPVHDQTVAPICAAPCLQNN